jgi:hypothetical protein
MRFFRTRRPPVAASARSLYCFVVFGRVLDGDANCSNDVVDVFFGANTFGVNPSFGDGDCSNIVFVAALLGANTFGAKPSLGYGD